MADETVTQRLEFDASQALQALKEVNEAADTTAGKANLLNKKLQDYSRSLGQSWKTTLAQMKELAGTPNEQFTGFNTPLGKDVTDDVFKQTEALAKASAAKNQYVTEDAKAAASALNFDGSVKKVNVSIGEQSQKLQVLARELNTLKYPTQGRNELGQFTAAAPPSFETQFKGLSTYQQQLGLVQSTIAKLHETTNLPFKDIGAQLGKSFPELLKDTNLVSTAVANLTKQNQGLSASFKTEAEVITLVQQKLTQLQAQGRLNLTGSRSEQIEQLKNTIREVSLATGAQYGDVANQMEKMGIKSAQANAAVKGLNAELTHGTREAQGMGHSIDVVRTALGTLTAVGIFTFISTLTKSFQEAVKASRELEDSLYRLSNVEKILSGAGIETSMTGLKNGIKEIKKLFPIFSEEDVTQLVAQVAISTKELGLSEKQILDLAKAIAILNIRSTEEETASQTAQKVISSLITGNAKGISTLGVSFSENTMKIKGMEMGLITAKKSLSDLTDEEKGQIKYQILLENVGGELDNVGKYLDTNTAKVKENKAAWHDLLTAIGSVFTAFTPLFTPVLKMLTDSANTTKGNILLVLSLFQAVVELRKQIALIGTDLTSNPVEQVKKLAELFKSIPNLIKGNIKDKVANFFPNVADAPDWIKNLLGNFEQDLDTPTAAVDNFQKKLDSIDTTKAQDAIHDLLKSLEDLQKQMAEKEADFQLKLSRFDQDTAREREQIVEDYNLNVQQTIRQFNLRRQDMERKYRQRELDEERRFQEQLRQLREKFLYNLEDALRERDARQVLRLIDQYNMEKQNLINENALRKKAADENHKLELDQLKREEEERLRVMAEEQAIRLQRYDEESALKRQRMEEDHAIEMQKLKEQEDEKIRAAADKIAEEYNLNAQGADALYNLLKQYYGTDGALANLTTTGYNFMLQQAGGFLAQIAAVIAQYQAMMAGAMAMIPGMNYSQNMGTTSMGTYVGGLAKGGQFVATKPTTATFGEGGEPELVTITPLSKLGSLQTKQPLNGVDGLDGQNGQQKIILDMNLSPDLEARVVQRAMDGTANVVERINRTKVR